MNFILPKTRVTLIQTIRPNDGLVERTCDCCASEFRGLPGRLNAHLFCDDCERMQAKENARIARRRLQGVRA